VINGLSNFMKTLYMTLSVDMMKKMGKYAMPGLAANDGKTFDTKPTPNKPSQSYGILYSRS